MRVLTAGAAKLTADVLTAGSASSSVEVGGSGGSGGSGATVTAINKTGATIFTGQKVWINENAQTQGSNYQIGTAGNYQEFKMGAIDRTGLFGYYYNNFYNIGEDSAELVGAVPNPTYLAIGRITYMADNSVFANSPNYPYRFDGQSQWNTTAMYCIADNWFSNSRGTEVYQVNMSNGEIITTFTNSKEMVTNTPVKVGDYIYRLHGSSNAQYKWLINYDTLTLTQSYYTFTNAPYQYELVPAGVTTDNKYILCSQFTPAYTNGGNYLYIVEVLEDGNLRGLSQSEMPVDMQKWYSTKCGYVFNPYTGILTVYEYQGADYGIYRYEGNGTWTQLPIDLGTTEETKFCAPITVSDDLSRACYTHYSNYNQGIKASVIVNLTTTEGYSAVPYRFYNVNENTITGYAGNDTEADMDVIVGIGSVPVIDNGGTGGTYEPTTPPLEEVPFNDSYIDTNKIVSVGRVFNTDRNEPTAVDLANLTENSGFAEYSNSLFSSEDKSLADEFLIRFHFSDRVGNEFMKMQFIYLFGHNTASDGGNWWDEKDRSSQFAIPFGFDSEWNYKTFGVNTGFVDENGYHSPNTRVDIGGDLQFGWNTIKMYYNNDIQSWVLAFGDNFSMEYSIPDLPKVCKPYNLISLVDVAGYGDNCIDLAETGFRKDGQWVWRAVK